MWLVGSDDTFWDYFPAPRYRATWPFAKLHATREQLTISAPMVGTFMVTHGNLASITPFGWIPVLAHGLRFEACFRRQVAVLWTGNRSAIIAELAELGWHINEQP